MRDPVANRIAAALMLIVGGVHFQQYVDFMSHVPTVGILFLLNAAGATGIAVVLLGSDHELRRLAALGAIGLCAGSLICLVIALVSSFAGFHEPSLRFPIVLAIVTEAVALPLLGRCLVSVRPGTPSTAPPLPGAIRS